MQELGRINEPTLLYNESEMLSLRNRIRKLLEEKITLQKEHKLFYGTAKGIENDLKLHAVIVDDAKDTVSTSVEYCQQIQTKVLTLIEEMEKVPG